MTEEQKQDLARTLNRVSALQAVTAGAVTIHAERVIVVQADKLTPEALRALLISHEPECQR